MRTLLLCSLALTSLSADPLAVVSLQSNPEQIARSLRLKSVAIPMVDCHALNLWECHADEPKRMTDIALRWVQLDEDVELEAVLTADAPAEDSHVAYVFDRVGTWNLVGTFFCRRHRCDLGSFIRIDKLTLSSPPLLHCYRDLGGSGTILLTTEIFHLRGGKLWPVFQVNNYGRSDFVEPFIETERVLASSDRIVIQTERESPPGTKAISRCEVWRWDAQKYTLVRTPADNRAYCDPNKGAPRADKAHPIGFARR